VASGRGQATPYSTKLWTIFVCAIHKILLAPGYCANSTQVAGYFRNVALGISAGAGYIRQVAVKRLRKRYMFLPVFVCLSVFLSVCKQDYPERRAWIWMKRCVSTDVGTWTNWLTFEPDHDYSPDAGTRLPSPILYALQRKILLCQENPTYRLGLKMVLRPTAAATHRFTMVSFTASRRNNFVGGTCGLPSALLIMMYVMKLCLVLLPTQQHSRTATVIISNLSEQRASLLKERSYNSPLDNSNSGLDHYWTLLLQQRPRKNKMAILNEQQLWMTFLIGVTRILFVYRQRTNVNNI